ncbi:Hint domain-containing protein [uncultured Tateyamaria sp.]|uniref:Hint domain-containing protein n=1 Tax=uncultured Tateyamaria sp. TaxID=455651 RepID=UPI00261347DA|nr:Hint domain-containing protein [uncultured Tateyamaria sp.]
MFLNHDTAFAEITPVASPMTPRISATMTAHTMLETEAGWTTVDGLQAGDAVATLDGGFAPITAITRSDRAAPLVHIPGGVLSTCSDITLPADAYVALHTPAGWIDAPVVAIPVKALSGWRGVRPTLFHGPDLAQLHFDTEEMIFAQTGLLIHAAPATEETFFPRLDYGNARAMLAATAGKFGQPDTVAA